MNRSPESIFMIKPFLRAKVFTSRWSSLSGRWTSFSNPSWCNTKKHYMYSDKRINNTRIKLTGIVDNMVTIFETTFSYSDWFKSAGRILWNWIWWNHFLGINEPSTVQRRSVVRWFRILPCNRKLLSLVHPLLWIAILVQFCNLLIF